MIYSIEFSDVENRITVTLEDLSSKSYFGRESYLADWPDRAADCAAMGW